MKINMKYLTCERYPVDDTWENRPTGIIPSQLTQGRGLIHGANPWGKYMWLIHGDTRRCVDSLGCTLITSES